MASQQLTIPAGPGPLPAVLTLPASPLGLVLFVHGSGSSHRSPRNRSVAAELERAGLGTLLFDLLSPAEQRRGGLGGALGVPMPLLGERVQRGLDWLTRQPSLAGLFPVGLFGASTGAAAALLAAATRPHQIAAIVSRGGRPDLATEALAKVLAPTLLIVGSRDPDVLALNRAAGEQLRCPHQLAVVEGAGHLFEEAGSLAQVGALSRDWFLRWLRPGAASPTAAAPGSGMALPLGVRAWT